jgi:hypothetical protein
MGWIKRNLFFVVVGILTLGLLGGAGFYIYKGWSNNSDANSTLTELYNKLQEINNSPLKPGDEHTDNTKIAKDQEQQMRDWISQAAPFFHPIQPIPQGPVTSKTYATALGSTIYQLTQAAKENGVNLPPQYYFSFQAQSRQLTISSGLEPLAQQLGEVKALSEILFAARVNDLVSIQRVRVSDDDVASSLQSDYIDERPVTNDLAIVTPYVVTFQTFTPELARVLSGFATSTNPFIVKWVSAVPASGAEGVAGVPPPGGMPPYPPGGLQPGVPPPISYLGQPGMPPQQPQSPSGAGKGGLQTVLKEQLLRITIEVEIVKLLPKN